MSAPIILGDALYHSKDMIQASVDPLPFIVAMLSAAIAGLLSIRFLMGYLKKKGFGIFTMYRLVLGTVIIAIYFLR